MVSRIPKKLPTYFFSFQPIDLAKYTDCLCKKKNTDRVIPGQTSQKVHFDLTALYVEITTMIKKDKLSRNICSHFMFLCINTIHTL